MALKSPNELQQTTPI